MGSSEKAQLNTTKTLDGMGNTIDDVHKKKI